MFAAFGARPRWTAGIGAALPGDGGLVGRLVLPLAVVAAKRPSTPHTRPIGIVNQAAASLAGAKYPPPRIFTPTLGPQRRDPFPNAAKKGAAGATAFAPDRFTVAQLAATTAADFRVTSSLQ